MILKQYWAHSGYDAEELYFAKVNRELIDRIRAKREKEGTQPQFKEDHSAEVIPFPNRKASDAGKKAA
jgi:hypothetical protein